MVFQIRNPQGENLIQKLMHNRIDVGGLSIGFQRTTRVPEGQINDLPAGLGYFPVFKVGDFKSGAPGNWREEGYFMPMYRQEAMWISFGHPDVPKALIVGAGNINAVTGKPFDPSKEKLAGKRRKKSELEIKLETPQNYMVVPPQPWLDGWKAEDGKIYQFVAAELGSGETVEGQITGEETAGGIQLIVYDPKDGQNLIHATRPHEYVTGGFYSGLKGGNLMMCSFSAETPATKSFMARSMGLGRGGEISQKIYPDPHGIEVWKKSPTVVDIVYLVSSEDFKQVTGYEAPPTPVSYQEYQKQGLPWFDLHDQKYKDTKGSGIFEKLKPVGEGKAK